MTKIEIEIPEWTERKNLYIFAGIEVVAYKTKGEKWMVKSSRCSQCGYCCQHLDDRFPFQIDGVCKYLQKQVGNNDRYQCGLMGLRPHSCGISPSFYDKCTVKYEEVS